MLNLNQPDEDNEEFTLNKTGDKDSESRKAEHVKNQTILLDKLLQSRIKYNKVLLNCDKLEEQSCWNLKSNEVQELNSNTTILLERLIEVQNEIFKSNAKLRGLVKEKSKSYKKSLVERFDKFKTYRNQILNKWESRVKLFSLNNQSANTEVDILTKINKFTSKHQTDNNQQQFNAFLKHDQEFYATLVKEFIERKGTDMNLAKQIKSTKVKKLVDTKSSKGRKIRYVKRKCS